ncbi:MAG: putative toxin-antitoxin system toxin component, PIN family [Selenomonadaceae bacterium]|nr:putative toxin-antitoxin system toxin component, PIN family [Selenomonadaceae bacterium]
MRCYAVIDTNVLISAVISKQSDAATVKVLRKVFDGSICPIYNSKILEEYNEVLRRPKFHLQEQTVAVVISAIKQFGIELNPMTSSETMIDEDDRIFLDTAIAFEGSFLVTGNMKHFPNLPIVVSPKQMLDFVSGEDRKI